MCPFYTGVAGSGKVAPVNQVNNTSLMTVVTPIDRRKSVHNRFVIGVFVLTLHLFGISVDTCIWAFVV